MMSASPIILLGLLTVLFLGCDPQEKSQPLLTIQLGGQSCEMYQGAVSSALTQLPGVEATDFTSKKGHVLVRGNPETMKAEHVLEAVNGLQGEGWSCTGKLVP